MADKIQIAVVNHDAVYLNLIRLILDGQGYDPIICPEGASAHAIIVSRQPDLVLLDTWLDAREGGWSLLQTLRLDQATRHIPILITSSDAEEVKRRTVNVQRMSKVMVLSKPFEPETLLGKILEALEPPSAK